MQHFIKNMQILNLERCKGLWDLVDFEKCWQNEYLVAKIGFYAAQNEPSKVSRGEGVSPIVSHPHPTVSRGYPEWRTNEVICDKSTRVCKQMET